MKHKIEISASHTLKLLAAQVRTDMRESAASPMSAAEAAAVLEKSSERVFAAASERLAKCLDNGNPAASAARSLQLLLDEHGRPALVALVSASATGTNSLSAPQRASLEALIKLTGRPSLRVKNDRIDFNDPDIGPWREPLLLLREKIPHIVRSVGRIDVGAVHVGTGFLIADDLVMTNRHVLEALVTPSHTITSPKGWLLSQQGVTIDFRRESASPSSPRFNVIGVEFAGPIPTNGVVSVDFANLDLAVLRIAKTDSAGQPPPPPLSFLKGELSSHASQQVLVVGFPAPPAPPPLDGKGHPRQDVIDALKRIYNSSYGVKYLSPGEVSALPGTIAEDVKQWVFSHDATTLGGNSGSCVVRYGPRPGVIGLHFAGSFERANYAHALTRVVSGGQLPTALQERLHWIGE